MNRSIHVSFCLLALALGSWLVVGCGGGSADTSARMGPAVTGQVFPAVGGLVFAELDEDGTELQTSSPSDEAGRFTFGRAFTGVRIQSTSTWESSPAAVSAPRVYSAVVSAGQTVLEVTPLSSLYEAVSRHLGDSAAAHDRLHRLIGAACGSGALVGLGQAFAGDPTYRAAARTALLPAVDAYLTALTHTGHSPAVLPQAWLARAESHAPVLGDLCQLAGDVLADTWLTQVAMLFAGRGRPADAPAMAWIVGQRELLLRQALELRAQNVVALEFGTGLGQWLFDIESWRGREAVLLQELAFVSYDASRSLGQQGDSPVQHVLDFDGQIRQRLDKTLAADFPGPGRVVFTNRAQQDARFELALNGRRLTDARQVVRDLMSHPAAETDELLQRRAWRYLVSLSRHSYPLSENLFVHQPDLFLRSIGTGFCDDMASALHWIWRELGLEARVVGIGGHVVAEVRSDDRWEMYDPDYGVYLHNRDGVVASVRDLEIDQTPLGDPVESLRGYPHVRNLAALYASVDDNLVSTFYSRLFPDPVEGVITLPPGASLAIDARASLEVPSVDDMEALRFGRMTIQLPPGFAGVVQLPAVLIDVEGPGSVVSVLGVEHDIGERGLRDEILERYRTPEPQPDTAITRLDVRHSAGSGVRVTMLVNESLLATDGSLAIKLFGDRLTGVVAATIPLSAQL